MFATISFEELSSALDDVAAELLDQAGISGPPVDAWRLAERLGLTVAWDDRQTGRARLVQLPAAGSLLPAILVRHDPRSEREHWAVAHEIGEAAAERVFRRFCVDPREAPWQAREQIANGIAGRLLLPLQEFSVDGPASGWDLFTLKQRYATASHELIARRMLDFSPPIIVAVYDHDKLTWRKSNLPGRLPPPSPPEIEFRRQGHENGEVVYADGPPSLRVWPIHEPQWKREIVRVENDEFAVD